MNTSKFYDNFIPYQLNSGINERIFHLYKRVCKSGLASTDKVLEIGCGIGILTYLLSIKIKKGEIEVVDISKKSIEFAKKHLKKANVQFTVSSILQYKTKLLHFDKILLFDTLEHIPEENHLELFTNIGKWLSNDGIIFINIPNPNYILYKSKKSIPKHFRKLTNLFLLMSWQPFYPRLLWSLNILKHTAFG